MEHLEEYAKINNIPIMQKDGIDFLIDYCKKNNVKKILEIGSAIGYSAIKLASINEDMKIITIERDEKRYNEAVSNIKKYGCENKIEIIFGDALETTIEDSYDLIFIDAAKAQYINFFEKYKVNLNKNGVIVSDNLNFHGLVEADLNTLTRNVRGLVRKLNNYVSFLNENEEFNTEFYTIGDGISISKKISR